MKNSDYDELDRKEIEFILRLKENVAVIYRIGSRATGNARTNSDMDYLVLLDWDRHYPRANTLYGLNSKWSIYIEKIFFTRKDLDEPTNMEGVEDKLLFLFGKDGSRELLYGEDVFDDWLNPDIKRLFEQYGITEKTVTTIKALKQS